MTLPPELAPALRERAEQLLAACSPPRPVDVREDQRDRTERSGRPPCYVCHRTGGAMGGHHVIPGDDSSVVPVHPACHRRLHRKDKAPAAITA